MIIDLDRYRACHPIIKAFLDRKSEDQRFSYIGEAAIVTGCHIIAVCHYYGEVYGYSKELVEMLGKLMLFYKVTDVVGMRYPQDNLSGQS